MFPPGMNMLGTAIFFGGFLPAFGLTAAFSGLTEGPATILGGALVLVIDLVCRRHWLKCRLLDHRRGGTFVFVPMWIVGAFWVLLGSYDSWTGA